MGGMAKGLGHVLMLSGLVMLALSLQLRFPREVPEDVVEELPILYSCFVNDGGCYKGVKPEFYEQSRLKSPSRRLFSAPSSD